MKKVRRGISNLLLIGMLLIGCVVTTDFLFYYPGVEYMAPHEVLPSRPIKE